MKVKQFTMAEVHDVMVGVGFSPNTWRSVTCLSVVWAESGGNAYAININDADPTAEAYMSMDIGICQWNSRWSGLTIPQCLDPVASLAAMYSRTADWTRNQGLWHAYTGGAYRKYLPLARVEFGL